MPIQIPKVPQFCEKPPKVPMFSEDDEREKDYERDSAYSKFRSKFMREDDEDDGEGGVKEEDKEKEKEKEKRKEQEKKKEKRKERARRRVDLFTRLYFERVLLYFGELTEEVADRFIELIMYGNMANPKKKTRIYIHSRGGDLNAAVRLYDFMQHASSGLDTVCAGITASTATFILSVGNKREAFAHSRIMIGNPKPIPPYTYFFPPLKKKREKKWKDPYPCLAIQRGHKLTRILIEQLAKRTGKSEQTVKNDLHCQWPTFMLVEEAQIHGIIDSVVDEMIL